MKPIKVPPDLVQLVYSAIRDSICAGELAPGERLNQEAVAERLQVSRQPIVQAIVLLKNQGFVKEIGRRGVEVAQPSAAEISGFYAVRAVLDGLAAREAADHGQQHARRQGPEILQAGREACRSGLFIGMLQSDMDFHQFIYRLSANPVIENMVAPHWHQLRRVMGSVLRSDYPHARIWNEHEAILSAIIAGDAPQAERLAREHAEGAQTMMADKLRCAATSAEPKNAQNG